MRKWLTGTLIVTVVGLAVFFNVPTLVDGRMNTVIHPAPYAASAQARAAHRPCL